MDRLAVQDLERLFKLSCWLCMACAIQASRAVRNAAIQFKRVPDWRSEAR